MPSRLRQLNYMNFVLLEVVQFQDFALSQLEAKIATIISYEHLSSRCSLPRIPYHFTRFSFDVDVSLHRKTSAEISED